MARTVKQWKKEVLAIFESEGGKNVRFAVTGSTHLGVSADFNISPEVGVARLALAVSVSPSHTSAGHRVRRDLRRLIQSYPIRKESAHGR